MHILELGNFAVTYRISGLLTEPKQLLSCRSALYGSILDTLHRQQVEIMSPSFMNQRKISDKVLPKAQAKSSVHPQLDTTAENIRPAP
ncbi:hypothetical protein GCM10009098_30290 [Rheinheimera aquimaris]|uniref:Uncharacterized protein n=1 Tax=Rheinheimera aquimaris TaxID=412437 RepID=A0ABN1E6L2_9GAMM|nr:hypothetical protein [Rheinheimera aquimaris]MCB5214372.1 hypothetical protein [Rheinheimera aquimaris]